MEENTTDLSKILSISGKPGLYKTIAQVKTGVVVESLIDGKRFQAFAHNKVSSLEEISVFTETEDKPLKEILNTIREKTEGGKAPDPKADDRKLKDFFETILPDYDRERVYVSHIKKICAWYNLLQEKEMLDFLNKEIEPEEAEKPAEPELTPEQPAKQEEEPASEV